jgi:carbamoyl-phosphate synthase large subunit
VIYDAIALGIPLSIHEITKIDMWFLKQYEELYTLEKISNYKVETLPKNCY